LCIDTNQADAVVFLQGHLTMFEPPGLRVIVIWIVGALIAGGAVLASGRQSWWPAVIILLLTMCVTALVQDG
jgi:hypothetical protein